MKYIDAEKLIAEVKFAKSVYSNPNRVIHGIADGFRQDGMAAMCDDFLTIIASLQQEQPEVDLEKEIDAFFDKWDKNSHGCIFDENGKRVTIETIKRIVKDFLNARKEE